jgi:hypothetical protein
MMNTGNTQQTRTPATQNAVLASDPEKAMQDMMSRIDTLKQIYLEENEALAHSDTFSYMLLQDRKIEAAQDYQSGATEFLKRKEEMESLTPATREQFKVLQAEFTTTTTENLARLERMQKGVGRLHERVINAAKETVTKDGVNYGAKAELKRHSSNMSMGLNESA